MINEIKPIYLDYNATTPIHPTVFEAMRPFLTGEFGNPSSSHSLGFRARQAVDIARVQVAKLVACDPEDVTFTSGGSESNNNALVGTVRRLSHLGRHVITSAVEHPAIDEVLKHLEKDGLAVTRVRVDSTGMVDPDDVFKALRPDTIMVTIMHANNEVGTLMPLADIASRLAERDLVFHTDAAQSVGKVPAVMGDLGVSLMSIAGHKLYAPKGIGVLAAISGAHPAPLVIGANHEFNRRAGTENVPSIVALGMACELTGRELALRMEHTRRLSDTLQARIFEGLPEGAVRLNGHPKQRLPNTLSLGFKGIEAAGLLAAIGDRVAASAGAACHIDGSGSTVLSAMGVPTDYAMGTIRFSTGAFLTEEDVERAATIIVDEARRILPNQALVEGAELNDNV